MIETTAKIELISINGKKAIGVKIDLGNAPLLVIKGEKGYLMCGYLNIDIAEKLGDAAAVVTGVKDFNEMLSKEVKYVTSKAKELGIHEGMKGIDALKKLM